VVVESSISQAYLSSVRTAFMPASYEKSAMALGGLTI